MPARLATVKVSPPRLGSDRLAVAAAQTLEVLLRSHWFRSAEQADLVAVTVDEAGTG